MEKKTRTKARSPKLHPAAKTRAAFRHAVVTKPSAPFKLKADKIESALANGEHADLLQRYFGEREYAELQGLARDANARAVRGGPRVLILPGIMGSTLGSKGRLFIDDVIWVDPIDIASGHLTTLSLIPGPVRHTALGVILFVYLRMKLFLKLDGFDAEFHPFDWRQSIESLGNELAKRILDEPAREVSLVAHSMGGLVSRAALKSSSASGKVKRLITLGTPNFGSFVPILALRGIYPIVRKIALLDLTHSPESLAETVFGTFPGLYEMLPAAEKFSGFDVFDSRSWPKDAPTPRQKLLDAAKKAQSFLAPPDERFIIVAGINQETVTGASFDGSQFTFSKSNEGDGTVPLAFAQLPNVPTYFVEESHGSLPNNSKVISAVKDLLTLGTTTVLSQQFTPQRAAAKKISEADVRSLVPGADVAPRGQAVSDKAVRELLEEVASPVSKEEIAQDAAGAVVSVKGVVVGRRLQRRLEVRLAHGSITAANSRAYVLGIFRDVTPTGAAQAIDLLMDGAIAEFSSRRMFDGAVGEMFVIPTGSRALRPDYVLLAGLGTFDRFTGDVLELVTENVIRTLVRSSVDDFATVLVGGSSGRDIAASLKRMLDGFVRGLLESDVGHNFRRVTVCETDPDRFVQLREQLYRLGSTELFDQIEVSFDEVELPPPPSAPAPSRGLASVTEAPMYLIVRQESSLKGDLEMESSLLTSGSKAAVVTGRNPITKAEMNALLARIESRDSKRIVQFGVDLGKLVLHEDVLAMLRTMPQKHLVVVHDADASRIPWETIRVNQSAAALEGGVSRRLSAEKLSVAKLLEQRKRASVLKILLVVDPTSNLEGAVAEGERIRTLFSSRPGFELVERFQSQATKPRLLKDFSSGDYDVLHYAGHAFFDPVKPARSGILCAGEDILSGAELVGLSRLPNLVFFNACEAGRIRKAAAAPAKGTPKSKTIRERIDDNIGLAEAYLRGGAANYVGTYWPVGDAAAKTFAEEFYTQLINGTSLGDSLLSGRKKVEALKSVDWADYVLYGNPDFVLKEK